MTCGEVPPRNVTEHNGHRIVVTTRDSYLSSQGLCGNCGERPGTITWGDLLALTHGGGTLRCELCAIKTQLEHARERAAAIPELEARLAHLQAEALAEEA